MQLFGLQLVECHDFSIYTIVMIEIFDAPALEALVIRRSKVQFPKTDAHKRVVYRNYRQLFHRFEDLFRHDVAHDEAATRNVRRIVLLWPEVFGDVVF